jgi:hypothetical protein
LSSEYILKSFLNLHARLPEFLSHTQSFCCGRKKEPVRNKTAEYACASYCEHRIDQAMEKLRDNNMRHAYQILAEILRKDHRSEKHKSLEKKALDIIITSLGRSLNPGNKQWRHVLDLRMQSKVWNILVHMQFFKVY